MGTLFNLVERRWIPCLLRTGEREDLSLEDVLVRAHELERVYDNSPTITASLHRLLLAVLYRTHPLSKGSERRALWKRGRFDEGAIRDYLGRWRHRFELFDEVRPFYQSVDEETRQATERPIALLAHELASGNNATLFDHSYAAQPRAVPPGEAARLLVATQHYALGGGVSKPFNFSHAPLIAGAVVTVRGESLFQTLVLNMPCYTGASPIPNTEEDKSAWEWDTPPRPSKRAPFGYLDYLTWQSRRIQLISGPDGVSELRMLQGAAVDAPGLRDPMMAYRRNDKESQWHGLRFQADRALWRDANALLPHQHDDCRHPPAVVRAAEELVAPGLELRVDVIGLCSDQAKVDAWRHEQFPLPVEYLMDEARVGDVERMLDHAEKVGEKLRKALWTLAERLLAPGTGAEARAPDRDAVQSLRDSFPSERHYWAGLEAPFHRVFHDLPDDPEGSLDQWNAVVRDRAKASLEIVTNSLDGSARALKASAVARQRLGRSLWKLAGNGKEASNAG